MRYRHTVAMKVTKEQGESLKPALIDMGRQINIWGHFEEYPFLTATNDDGLVGNYDSVRTTTILVNGYNPELFLAIAAMTDDVNGNIGEWWKCIDDNWINFTEGKIYKQVDNSKDFNLINDLNHFYGVKYLRNLFTKATKEEIISTFSKKVVEDKKVCFKGDGTKEKGDKIISELEKLGGKNSAALGGHGTSHSYYFIGYDGGIDLDRMVPNGYTLTELPSEVKVDDKKVCFLSDGTIETGDKIIAELKKLGINTFNYNGRDRSSYYYGDDDGEISVEISIPKGYVLKEFPFEIKLNVGDAIKVKPGSRYKVVGDICWRNTVWGSDVLTVSRDIQYIFKIEGDLIYIDDKGYNGSRYLVVERENIELVKSEITEIKMKNRILTPENATKIINIACNAWKSKLAEVWAKNIVLGKDTEVPEGFYTEMRKACTADQNTLFDEIFGKDEQLIDVSELAIGESMIVVSTDNGRTDRWNGTIVSRIWTDDGADAVYVNMNDTSCTWSAPIFKGKRVKLTITHEEVK